MAAIAVIAAVVLGGWQWHVQTLIRVVPGAIAMQPNTALCFLVLSAAGLSLFGVRLPVGLTVAGALWLIAVPALDLAEYRLHRSFGIDTFLIQPWETHGTVFPGLMAPLSAISFLAMGVALLVVSRWPRRFDVLAWTGMFALSLGLVSLIGHLAGVAYVFPYRVGAQMAIPTAVCFILWGGAVIAHGWRCEPRRIVGLPAWSPGLAFAGTAVFLISFGVVVRSSVGDSRAVMALIGGLCSVMAGVMAQQNLRLRQGERERIHRLAQEVDGRTRELHSQRELNLLLIDHVPAAIAFVDLAGIVRWNNPEHGRMFARQSADLLGHSLLEAMPLVDPQDAQALGQAMIAREAVQLSGLATLVSTAGNVRMAHWDLSVVPMFGEAGEPMGRIVMAIEVTDRVAREEFQAHQLQHLQQMDRMKDEFLSIVSHELRTPLTSIHGSIKLLASGQLETMPDKRDRMLQIASQNMDRLVRLTNDILDVARIESGRLLLCPAAIPVEVLLERAVSTMQQEATGAGVTLVWQGVEETLLADPDRIVQVLVNLLSNAIKFSPPGSTVRLEARLEGAQVVFEVGDEGCGIPEAKLNMVFDRFEQVDPTDARRAGGSGLGLSICRNLVSQHGGTIGVRSVLTQGSQFWFTLPRAEKADPPS